MATRRRLDTHTAARSRTDSSDSAVDRLGRDRRRLPQKTRQSDLSYQRDRQNRLWETPRRQPGRSLLAEPANRPPTDRQNDALVRRDVVAVFRARLTSYGDCHRFRGLSVTLGASAARELHHHACGSRPIAMTANCVRQNMPSVRRTPSVKP